MRASLLALLVLVALGLFALAGTAGSAKNPNALSVGVVDLAPSEVTYGQNIAMRLTVTNVGANPWNKVVVLDPSPTTTVPDGDDPDSLPDTLRSTLKKLVCPGTTTNVAGSTDDVSCDLGTLEPDGVRTLILVWQTPAAGTAAACPAGVTACIKNVVTVKGNEGSAGPDAGPSQHVDTFTAEVVTTLLDTPGADKRRAGTYALDPCTTPATPTLSTNANVGTDNPLATSVCAPSVLDLPDDPGLQAYVAELDAPGQDQVSHICLPAAGFSCFDEAGDFVPAGYAPLQFADFATFTFTFTTKSYKGTLEVLYDRDEDGDFELVSSFDPTADPHLVSVTEDKIAKTTTVVVQSKQNGGWDFD